MCIRDRCKDRLVSIHTRNHRQQSRYIYHRHGTIDERKMCIRDSNKDAYLNFLRKIIGKSETRNVVHKEVIIDEATPEEILEQVETLDKECNSPVSYTHLAVYKRQVRQETHPRHQAIICW